MEVIFLRWAVGNMTEELQTSDSDQVGKRPAFGGCSDFYNHPLLQQNERCSYCEIGIKFVTVLWNEPWNIYPGSRQSTTSDSTTLTYQHTSRSVCDNREMSALMVDADRRSPAPCILARITASCRDSSRRMTKSHAWHNRYTCSRWCLYASISMSKVAFRTTTTPYTTTCILTQQTLMSQTTYVAHGRITQHICPACHKWLMNFYLLD